MNYLNQLNEQKRSEVQARVQRLAAARSSVEPIPPESYLFQDLRQRLTVALRREYGSEELTPQFDLIARERFGGDLAVKVPGLLSRGGPKEYIKTHVPRLMKLLQDETFADVLESVEQKGMYVNLKISTPCLLRSLTPAVQHQGRFGHNGSLANRRFVLDYSSPNAAKPLHAGHIRSTIIGHVLGNLYAACGATVFRVNHVNDFGGFGFSLEGYRRWSDAFPGDLSDNDKLLEIYAIRRAMERAVQSRRPVSELDDADAAIVGRYFPGTTTHEELSSRFRDFVTASDARFEALENGVESEVTLWQEMVSWSLADFQRFYDALDIHLDFTLGESFYATDGNDVVEEALKTGLATVFTQEEAETLKRAQLESTAADGANNTRSEELIDKDVGAVVVHLADGERLVVRRRDGRSIYATRDLGALQRRRLLFSPTDVIYIVGQEQRVHFQRLFEAARLLGIAGEPPMELKHVFFGFYVDAKTKKKLSSRQGASNVYQLLATAQEYFQRKYQDNPGWKVEEATAAAKQLAVGSLVFNDLGKDMKAPVDVRTENLEATVEAFEKSGGAYVVYAACRARSIIRKGQFEPRLPEELSEIELTHTEIKLILQILQIPDRVSDAAQKADPSILARHLIEIATSYSSYYAESPVIWDGKVNPYRGFITAAVQNALESGLLLCHVECPKRI